MNHGSRLVSKYTVQLRNGSTQVVSARDVYWPSPIAKNNAASTAPQDSGKTKGRAKKPKILSSSSSSEASESDKKRSYKRKHADQRKKSSKKRKPNSSSSSDSSDASSDSDSSQAKHKKASRSEQKRSKKSDKTRMREAAFKPDDVEDEDELDAIWVEAAAGAIVRGTPNKLDDADGESAEVVGVCNAATAATAAVREARGDELDGGG